MKYSLSENDLLESTHIYVCVWREKERNSSVDRFMSVPVYNLSFYPSLYLYL